MSNAIYIYIYFSHIYVFLVSFSLKLTIGSIYKILIGLKPQFMIK
jgi:hypothetical protein